MSDIPLGRPLQTVRLESTETVETPVLAEQKPVKQEEHIQPRSINESEMPSSGRPGDNAFGRPLHVPPPESGSSQYSLADLEREAVQAEVGELFTQPIKLPLGWISGFWLLILLFGGIIGWFMLAQIISTTHSILQLPLGLQIPAWGLVGFFSFLTIYPLMRLWLSYRRLRPVQQIHMTRVVTQGLSVTQLQSARQTISTYLKNYSFENNSLRKELESIGLSATEQQKLQSLQQDLLENALMSTDVWLKEFEQAFLAPLDKLAKTRIDYHAKRLGLKTALSPNALLDMVLVLHSGAFRYCMKFVCSIKCAWERWEQSIYWDW